MDLGQLETFLVVAREKSFSRAAERLYRTQPAVSLSLKRLEEELGEILVDRTTKGGTLTDAGTTLLPLAQRMFDLRKQIIDTFGSLKGLQQGRLNIGANESVSEFLLPSVLLAYQQAHPAIRIQAYRQSSERIPAEVLERRLDVGFVSYDPMHPELQSEVILRDHMVLVVPPGHRLAKRKEVSLEALGRETFVAHNAITPTRNAIIDLFARCGTPLRITMELGSLATIQEFVTLGAGLAILPRMTVVEGIRQGKLAEVAVKELQVEKLIRIVTRREEALSHAAKAFLQLIRATDFTPNPDARPEEAAMTSRTLYDKIWDEHLVATRSDGTSLLYIDRHLVHEVTSPQAFEGLREAGRPLRRPNAILSVADHNVPTIDREKGIADETCRLQVEALEANVKAYGVPYLPLLDDRQGIVHVVGPEQGFTLPGTTIVCGDSHTSTHGAFGALAFGIGTSEVEHVMATQTLPQRKSRNLRVRFEGALPPGLGAKDMALALIGRIGTAGGTGHVMEFTGPAVRALSMEGRMTLCNMSIEGGARSGLVAADDTTFAYLKGRPLAPKEALWETALAHWRTLVSDEGASFDTEVALEVAGLAPQVTWGTSPQWVTDISGRVPDPDSAATAEDREAMLRALEYMDLKPGTPIEAIALQAVFIGSCTNGRIEDLREAAAIARGRKVATGIRALVVPGSGLVKRQAEVEGLDRIFLEAGFEWRQPGCSMCLGMNDDRLDEGVRCASTSNRNFEGRQGRGSRTHLVSPGMAAAAAVTGHFTDVRRLEVH